MYVTAWKYCKVDAVHSTSVLLLPLPPHSSNLLCTSCITTTNTTTNNTNHDNQCAQRALAIPHSPRPGPLRSTLSLLRACMHRPAAVGYTRARWIGVPRPGTHARAACCCRSLAQRSCEPLRRTLRRRFYSPGGEAGSYSRSEIRDEVGRGASSYVSLIINPHAFCAQIMYIYLAHNHG